VITDTALAMVPPLSLLALPYLEDHDAERFNAGFGLALASMASDISAQASKDQAIGSLSIRQQPTIHPTSP
jgi:hypothetical protein